MLQRLAALAGILGLLVAIAALLRDTYDFTISSELVDEPPSVPINSSLDSRKPPATASRPSLQLPTDLSDTHTESKDLSSDLENEPEPSVQPETRSNTDSADMESVSTYSYEKLEAFLAEERWEYADLETKKILIEVTEEAMKDMDIDGLTTLSELEWIDKRLIRQPEIHVGYLKGPEIRFTPCETLREIDSLWYEASDGRFGLSTQKKIFVETANGKTDGKVNLNGFGNPYDTFARNVNWYEKSYSELIFSLDAPLGHLPFSVSAFTDPDPPNMNWILDDAPYAIGFYNMVFRLEQCGL